jgi:RNA polymerase sigma-70 factor (ECF subfamily)
MLEDRLLTWRFKHGSAEAFERIYAKYKDDLLRLAVVLLPDVHAAEDVVHDVFVHVAQERAAIRVAGNLKSFLAVSVVNRARNYRRGEKRRDDRAASTADCIHVDPLEPEPWAILSEELHRLSCAMAQLPEEQREAVALHEGTGMTFPEIARLQSVSVNTVQGRCRYGLNKLRSLLNSEDKE